MGTLRDEPVITPEYERNMGGADGEDGKLVGA